MKIGIFGSGSIGLAIASEIYKYYPEDIYLCAKNKYYDRLKNGVMVNNTKYDFKLTDMLKMDYLIICIKNYDLESSLSDISTFIDENTKILPLLNGISAHDVLSNYFKNNIIYYGMIRIEANRIGTTVNCSPITEIAFGNLNNDVVTEDVKQLKNVFDKCNINSIIYPDMQRAVWRKWMLNVGINQVSALMNASYNDMHHPYMREMLYNLFMEVVSIAKKAKVDITKADADFMMDDLKIRTSDRVTSLTEDFNNKRRNELDCFGLTVINLGKKYGVKTPYNEIIYKLLKAKSDNFLNNK